ncbi:MAG: RluA family pseudouridine synthase [Candidatus Omnitrophota bacterium]|nr:MAG: RluA family pseudouridine synthase [Candidatus Omnitrophota bacterium]
MEKKVKVTHQYCGMRLDIFLSKSIKSISRTKIRDLIKKGAVLVNGRVRKPSYSLKDKEAVCLNVKEEKTSEKLKLFKYKVPVIFEDNDIIVVDKPPDLVVHPPQPHVYKTLVNALVYMKKKLSDINPVRPGVVHRLDKETSGVMVLAKNNFAHLDIVRQFKERKVRKEYVALCWGRVEKEKIVVDLPLSRDAKHRLKMKVSFTKSKNAYTEIEAIERLSHATLLKIKPLTGRMHQIRVHLKFLGYPVVGDKKYGVKDDFSNLFLHAHRIGFYHPRGKNFIEFESGLPPRFKEFLEKEHSLLEKGKQ